MKEYIMTRTSAYRFTVRMVDGHVHHEDRAAVDGLRTYSKKYPGTHWKKSYEDYGVELVKNVAQTNQKYIYNIDGVVYNNTKDVLDKYKIKYSTLYARCKAKKWKNWNKIEKRHNMSEQPESVNVLQECIELQLQKSRDYQNPNSTVKQADYYPNGVITIHDIMHAKMLRMKSVMEAMLSDDYDPNFESLEDSAKDLINYTSFFVAYCRGEVPGQLVDHDIFNRKGEVQYSKQCAGEENKH